MSSLAFIFDILFSCLITLFFLYRCGNLRRQHPITTIAVFIAWFFSVLIVFILPLDISLVGEHQRSLSLTREDSHSRRCIVIVRQMQQRRRRRPLRSHRTVLQQIDVLVRGRTSIQPSIEVSGQWSIGHRRFSLGKKINEKQTEMISTLCSLG